MVPFRYKLTLLITVLICALLGGTYPAIQNVLEREFVSAIDQDLKSTRQLVALLMTERRNSLANQATILAGDGLVLDLFTDSSIDEATANDIIQSELLPNFPELVAIAVYDGDGKLVAGNRLARDITSQIRAGDFYPAVLQGQDSIGHLFLERALLQAVGVPVFIGEELAGALFAFMALDQTELDDLSALSGADLLLLRGNQVFLTTDQAMQGLSAALRDGDFIDHSRNDQQKEIVQVMVAGERFLYDRIHDTANFIPDHLIFISLDRKLAFSQGIYKDILIIGLVGIAIAILLSFLMARGISRPIQQLQAITREVDKANYSARVRIESRDEFALLGTSFNEMLDGLEERERIRGVMNKVVSKEIADVMLRGRIELGGELRHASILFADIRNFTRLSEHLPPARLLDFLNNYFTRASACIDQRQGVIDKYIGDAIMALFGLPLSNRENACDAVLAALDLIDGQEAFNRDHAGQPGVPLQIGIGINTGEVVAGNMGAQNRLNYTVLGNEVNVAARLEGLSKHYAVPLVISESTVTEIRAAGRIDEFPMRRLDRVLVQGKSLGLDVYQVFSLSARKQAGLRQCIDDYDAGHQLLLAGKFEESRRLFGKCLEVCPEDGAARTLHDRCERYLADPESFTQDYRDETYILSSK